MFNLPASLNPVRFRRAGFLFSTMELTSTSTVTEISVAYRRRKSKRLLPRIETSSDALIHILEDFDHKTIGMQEQVVCMYLNPANEVLGIYRASHLSFVP